MGLQTALEMSSPELRLHLNDGPLGEDSLQGYTIHPPTSIHDGIHSPRQAAGAGPGTQRSSLLSNGRCYDRPGKKPAAHLECDPVKLYDNICKERGGSNFATGWILTVFKYGVSGGVLCRTLMPQEIIAMNFTGGFEPQHVYDGFITKVGDQYECGLCKEDKKTHWKAKKNAPRHLRKFHFGLADVCKTWCAPPIPGTPSTAFLIVSELTS